MRLITRLKRASRRRVAAGGVVYPVLTTTLLTGVAPFGVVFDGVQTTCTDGSIDTFHDLTYMFDFGDTGAAEYTYGQLRGKTKNEFNGGPVTAFVYETPGTYTAKLWVTDGATVWGPVSQTITVTDPNVVYSSANTYYFHPTVTPVPGVDGVPSDATVGNCINKVNAGIGAFFVGLLTLGIALIVSNKKKIWQFK